MGCGYEAWWRASKGFCCRLSRVVMTDDERLGRAWSSAAEYLGTCK